MKVVAIIQARTGSTRLPGKVLKELAGEPMLARVVDRVRQARGSMKSWWPRPICRATTFSRSLCDERGWPCFRGSENDVLDRYYRAAVAHGAQAVVRITSDCPLIDPGIIDRGVGEFLALQPAVEYATNAYPRHVSAGGWTWKWFASTRWSGPGRKTRTRLGASTSACTFTVIRSCSAFTAWPTTWTCRTCVGRLTRRRISRAGAARLRALRPRPVHLARRCWNSGAAARVAGNQPPRAAKASQLNSPRTQRRLV